MKNEKWMDVVGYENEYMVSDEGRIKSLKRSNKPVILKTFLDHKGYPRINLMRNGKLKQVFVHRLVAESFIHSIPEGKVVNHIDGNKTNNNVPNLEIVTQSENVIHSCYVLGNGVTPVLMLDKDTFEIIKKFPSIAQASKEMNLDDGAIYKVCTCERNLADGYSWAFESDFNAGLIDKKKKKISSKYKHKIKKVKQINPDTKEVIAVYEGARNAIKQTGIKTIISCASGHCKTAGGFLWEYED